MSAKKKPGKAKRIIKKIILFIIIVAIIAGAGWFAYNKLKADYTVTYQSYTASIGSISNSLSYSGAMSLVDSTTYTASSAGTVKKIYVAAGDDVKDGDKLLRMNDGTTYTADFDGRVNTISVNEGDDVTMGDMLLQLADFTHMQVSIRVDEYDIPSVSVGQEVTVTTTASEQVFTSKIDSIDYISQSMGSVAYYTATLYVDLNGDEGVYPGMQVTVTIPQESAENVVILKMDALSFDASNSAYVMMYNDEGVLERRDVEVGVSNGNYVEIKSGLNDGDEVFVEVEVEQASGLSGLFQSAFGSTQTVGGGGMGGGNMPDMGSMPDMSSMGGNSWGSGNHGGNSSGGGMPSGGFPGGGN